MAIIVNTTSTGSSIIFDDINGGLAIDYSQYYARIATALEIIAVATSATLQTLNTVSTSLGTMSTTLGTISSSSSASATSAATSTATNAALLTSVQKIASSATFIGVMLESIASVNATSAAAVSGLVPTFEYPGSELTTSTAVFVASVGGTTGTTMYVNTISSGVVVPNMVVLGTYTNNIVYRQTSGELGSTGTYELLYNTGYKVSLNQGNSPSFTLTGTYTTGSIASITSTNILTTLQQITL